ncbi:MAG: hypothetical protein DHS80DRAFT_31831 [Piptocephalis tieghemiana]|nr:MAG: hypothetical protein DHS80DRAFT_31831 [Piptocephalis tieghemiana]
MGTTQSKSIEQSCTNGTDHSSLAKFRIPWIRRRTSSQSVNLPLEGIFDLENADTVEKNHLANDAVSFILRKSICSPVVQPERIILLLVGPSSWPRSVAMTYPAAEVIALDVSYHSTQKVALHEEEAEPLPGNLSMRSLNLFKPLDFPSGYADVVAVRSLLRVAPSSTWLTVMRECSRILKEGGWMENIDTDYLRWNPGMPSLVANRITERVMARRGIDISLAHNIPAVFNDLHYIHLRNGSMDIPIGDWGGVIGQIQAKVAIRFLNLFRHALETEGDQRSILEFDQVYPGWLQELETSETFNRYFITFGQKPISPSPEP